MVRMMSFDTKKMVIGLALICAVAPAVGVLGSLLDGFIGGLAFYIVFAIGALMYLMPWIAHRPFPQLKFVFLFSVFGCAACIGISLDGVDGILATMLYGWSLLAGCVMGITGMWIALDYQ